MNFWDGLPPLNRQALVGLGCLVASVALVKALNARWFVRLPGGDLWALLARFLLGFTVLAGLWYGGNALFGRLV